MSSSIMHYIRLFLQILPLFLILFSLQPYSKKNLKAISAFFVIIYMVNFLFEVLSLDSYAYIVMTLLTIILNSLFFKKDWIDSSIDYTVFLIIGFPVGLIVELVFMLAGLLNVGIDAENKELVLILYTVIMTAFSIALCVFIPLKKILDKYRIILRTSFLIVLNVFIFYFIAREDLITNSSKNISIITLSFAAIVLSNIFLFKELGNAKSREKMIRQHNEFISTFDSVITDIRSQQHDFKNHITTLKNLCFTDKDTYEEIATSYIDSINSQISNIDYLTASSNKVLGSVLFSKSCACNLKAIKFSFDCESQEITFPLEDYELTSIFANLIDNAIEALEKSDFDNKEILVKIGQTDKEKYFHISNTGKPIPFEISQRMFSKGYSTKNNNKKSHGYGLYNIKKIVANYKGNINLICKDDYVTFKASFKA